MAQSDAAQSGTKVALEDFSFGDRLAKVFISKQQWSPIVVGLIFFGYLALISSLVAIATGRLLPNPGYTALLQDYYYGLLCLLTGVASGYYVWLSRSPAKVLEQLQWNRIIAPTDEDIQRANRILTNRLWIHSALGLTCISGVFGFVQHLFVAPVWFQSTPLLTALFAILATTPRYFVVIAVTLKLLANALVFRQMLRDVALQPLHPDQAGGLRPLGEYAITTTYLIALSGSFLAFQGYWTYLRGDLSRYLFGYLVSFAYIVIAPLAFFAPLAAAHRAMRRAKEALLLKISWQFSRDVDAATDELSGSADALRDNIDKIEQLQEMYKLAKSFPVWPFDLETLRRFVAAMLSPVATIGISIAINALSQLITKTP